MAVAVSDADLRRAQQAAEQAGSTLSQWVRRIVREQARRDLDTRPHAQQHPAPAAS